MATVMAEAKQVEQKSNDYQHDQEKAQADMKKRWDQLKHRKQANSQPEE